MGVLPQSHFLNRVIRTDVRVILCIGLFVLTGYSAMLFSPFKTLDDDFSVVTNKDIRSVSHLPQIFTSTYFKREKDYYRPLVYVSYMIEYHLFRLNSFYYNLDNVLLHVINAFLVFLLALALLDDRLRAFGAAFLFAIHPVHWEAVSNVSGRAILLCSFFVLGGWLFFLKFVREQRPGPLVMAVLCYGLGLLCKESAGMLMVGMGCYWVIVARQPWRRLTILAPFLLVTALVFAVRCKIGMVAGNPWPSHGEMLLGVASFLRGTLTWARLLVLPLGLYFCRAQTLYQTFFHPQLLLTAAVYSGVAVLLIRHARRIPRLAWFCMGWILLELLPVSQLLTSIGFYTGGLSLAEHFLYPVSVPAFILCVLGVEKLYEKANRRGTISLSGAGIMAVLFGGFLFVTLLQQSVVASNEFLMVRQAIAADPNNDMMFYSLGRLYVDIGRFDLAVEPFEKAVALNPWRTGYRLALGSAWASQKEYLKAARAYEAVKPVEDRDRLLVDEGKKKVYGLLVNEYEERLRKTPGDPDLLFALGVFHGRLNEQARAYEAFAAVVDRDRTRLDALFNMGVMADMMGNRPKTEAAFTKLVALAPPDNLFRKQAEAFLKKSAK